MNRDSLSRRRVGQVEPRRENYDEELFADRDDALEIVANKFIEVQTDEIEHPVDFFAMKEQGQS